MSNTPALPDFLHPMAAKFTDSWTPPRITNKTWTVVRIDGKVYPMSAYEYWEHVEGRPGAEVLRVVHVNDDGDPFDGDPADLL